MGKVLLAIQNNYHIVLFVMAILIMLFGMMAESGVEEVKKLGSRLLIGLFTIYFGAPMLLLVTLQPTTSIYNVTISAVGLVVFYLLSKVFKQVVEGFKNKRIS